MLFFFQASMSLSHSFVFIFDVYRMSLWYPKWNWSVITTQQKIVKELDKLTIVHQVDRSVRSTVLHTAFYTKNTRDNVCFHARNGIKQKRSTEGCSKFKSPETWQVYERFVSTLEHKSCKSRNGTGPGVRRSKRSLLACRTRCICTMETLHN